MASPKMEISEAPSSIAGDHPPSTKKIEHRKTMSPRRFPPPWSIEELDACFVVIQSPNRALADRNNSLSENRKFSPTGPNTCGAGYRDIATMETVNERRDNRHRPCRLRHDCRLGTVYWRLC